MTFKDLHYHKEPLLLCNVWDVASAQIAEHVGFKAIATSSAAIAKSMGYDDGQQLTFSELLTIVKRIKLNIQIPLSVDLEAGYSDNNNKIIEHIHALVELGVSGVNIEDSEVKDSRQLLDSQLMADRLSQIVENLSSLQASFFINARTDPYLVSHPSPLNESLVRAKRYQKAGADGVFIPGMVASSDIQQLLSSVDIPVNLLALPDLPQINELSQLGIKRISLGNFLYERILVHTKTSMQSIYAQKSLHDLFIS